VGLVAAGHARQLVAESAGLWPGLLIHQQLPEVLTCLPIKKG